MRLSTLAAALVCATAIFCATTSAEARTKKHRDDVRGFQCSVEDSWEQVPPKPGTDDAHVAAVWKDPSPKYARFSGDQPTFKIIWTVTPKGDAPPEEKELPAWAKELPPEQQEQVRLMMSGTKETLEGELDMIMERLAFLFGEFVPIEERWAAQKKPKKLKTGSGQEVEVLEVNYHRKRPKDTRATWWLWIAKTGWETETERVELGFYGYVDVQFAKKFRKQYETAVKSFKLREIKEDNGSGRVSEFVTDPDHPEEQKIAKFIKEKVIKGWTYERTPHYLVVYDEDVDRKIIKRVTSEIEALRAQVYEVIFPPDKPIESISIVRVCETRKQYMAYGAPGGSAGYWSPYHEELVLFQDKNDKKDAIRVLYHEAFHQYIHYSVGEIAPHSWFNEGHGDFFSGHVYKSGKFKLAPFGWRTETAREAKKRWKKGILRMKGKTRPGAEKGETSDGPDRLKLTEWLTWRQPEYYGRNEFAWSEDRQGNERPIPGGVNYALGWSFIYFLRTTRNEEYEKILPRYFNTLKSFVTQDREAREKALEEGLEGGGEGDGPGEGEGGEPGEEGGDGKPAAQAPKPGETSDTVERSEWHGESLKEATQGLDLDQLEKDWLDHSW